MTDTLIGLSDLEDRLGQEIHDAQRALAVIADVSAVIRAYTGRTFTETESTVTVTPCNGTATLPDGPVLAIDSVEADGTPLSYTWAGGRTLTIAHCVGPVTVTYTHGWEEVPADIQAVAAQMAGRAYGTNPTDTGIQQETLGSYAVTLGSAAAAGPLGILAHEQRILDLYKTSSGPRTIPLGSWA